MSDNIYISNGTCYSAAGDKLDSSFIPCGNDAFGHQTCCGAGDNCLADNACFGVHGTGYGSYLTYMAGCTDSTYKDSSCPDKDGIVQPWIALTLCDNSGGVWAACSQSGNPTTLQNGDYCSCTDSASATVAFKDATSISSLCSLPQSTGESIQFFVGHSPTSRSTAGTTAAASSAGSTATGGGASATKTASNTSSPSGTGGGSSGTGGGSSGTGAGSSGSGSGSGAGSSGSGSSGGNSAASGGSGSSSSTGSSSGSGSGSGSSGSSSSGGRGSTSSGSSSGSGLSSGAKIGIGVGAGVGALILLAIIVALCVLRRRKRQRAPFATESESPPIDEKPSKHDSSDPQRASAISNTPTAYEPEVPGMAEMDGRAAGPHTFRSELQGSQVAPEHAEGGANGRGRGNGNLTSVAELPGTDGWQPEGVDLRKDDRYRLSEDSHHRERIGQPAAHGGVVFSNIRNV